MSQVSNELIFNVLFYSTRGSIHVVDKLGFKCFNSISALWRNPVRLWLYSINALCVASLKASDWGNFNACDGEVMLIISI